MESACALQTRTVSTVKCIEMVDISLNALVGIWSIVRLQPKVGEYTKPQPIRIWHLPIVHRPDPCCNFRSFVLRKGVPEVFASYSKSKANWTRLYLRLRGRR